MDKEPRVLRKRCPYCAGPLVPAFDDGIARFYVWAKCQQCERLSQIGDGELLLTNGKAIN